MVGLDYDDGKRSVMYFSKKLKRSGNGTCFTLGFENVDRPSDWQMYADPIDLVAVECE